MNTKKIFGAFLATTTLFTAAVAYAPHTTIAFKSKNSAMRSTTPPLLFQNQTKATSTAAYMVGVGAINSLPDKKMSNVYALTNHLTSQQTLDLLGASALVAIVGFLLAAQTSVGRVYVHIKKSFGVASGRVGQSQLQV